MVLYVLTDWQLYENIKYKIMHWTDQLSLTLLLFIIWKGSMGYQNYILDFLDLLSGIILAELGLYTVYQGVMIVSQVDDYTDTDIGLWIGDAVGLVFIIGCWWVNI